jgi:hypothetical protein
LREEVVKSHGECEVQTVNRQSVHKRSLLVIIGHQFVNAD